MEPIFDLVNSVVGFIQHPELASMEAMSAFGWTCNAVLGVIMILLFRSNKKSDRLRDRY